MSCWGNSIINFSALQVVLHTVEYWVHDGLHIILGACTTCTYIILDSWECRLLLVHLPIILCLVIVGIVQQDFLYSLFVVLAWCIFAIVHIDCSQGSRIIVPPFLKRSLPVKHRNHPVCWSSFVGTHMPFESLSLHFIIVPHAIHKSAGSRLTFRTLYLEHPVNLLWGLSSG